MAEQPSEEFIRFQEYLEAPGHTLTQFRVQTPDNMFPLATSEPNFFKENLVSPQRVLKVFADSPHANIRVFYFQLLRLTYEIETEQGYNRAAMNNLIHVVFNPQFEIFFTSETEDQRDLFNDTQFKKLFAEFINLLENQENPRIEEAVNTHPIIDLVFIHIIRSILASNNIQEPFDARISSEIIFSDFGTMLELRVAKYDECWKFEDSDIFCYQATPSELYVAYISPESPSHVMTTDRTEGTQQSQGNQVASSKTIEIPQQNVVIQPEKPKPIITNPVFPQIATPATATTSSGIVAPTEIARPYTPSAPIAPLVPPPASYDLYQPKAPSYTPSYSTFGEQGDYYRDFTDDRIIEIMLEPYRSTVVQIKNRIKGLKRGGGGNSAILGGTGSSYTSQSRLGGNTHMSASGFNHTSYAPVDQRFGNSTTGSGIFNDKPYTASYETSYGSSSYNYKPASADTWSSSYNYNYTSSSAAYY